MLQRQQEEVSSPRNRGIIKDESGNISAGGGGATHTHGPRRLKGRLEVHRELRLCHQTPLNTALAPQAPSQHCCVKAPAARPGHFVLECTELCCCCSNAMQPRAVHWKSGALGDFSATVLRHYCPVGTLCLRGARARKISD